MLPPGLYDLRRSPRSNWDYRCNGSTIALRLQLTMIRDLISPIPLSASCITRTETYQDGSNIHSYTALYCDTQSADPHTTTTI